MPGQGTCAHIRRFPSATTATTVEAVTADRTPAESAATAAGHHRILTSDRPTGPLYLDHYFGTLRNRIELQPGGSS
ncbi:hypothetical protein ACFC6L_27225 [Kitasatospora phosalacinea]|uniref:hypothetical protein n=1 Tax=Kitasatospora phosalacinea TaxID=2065 RepID=UPI0035DB932A